MTDVPAIDAAHRRRAGGRTVRDYWPVCYWSDLIHTRGATLCPACSAAMMTRCIRPRAGAAWPLALPMIPYMRANLARKRSGLAARRRHHRRQLDDRRRPRRARAGARRRRVEVIPNPVDIAALARAPPRRHAPHRRTRTRSIVGKLAPNKGTSHLVDVVERARSRLAAGRRRRRSRSRGARGAGAALRTDGSASPAGSIRRATRLPGSRTRRCWSFRRAAPSR